MRGLRVKVNRYSMSCVMINRNAVIRCAIHNGKVPGASNLKSKETNANVREKLERELGSKTKLKDKFVRRYAREKIVYGRAR